MKNRPSHWEQYIMLAHMMIADRDAGIEVPTTSINIEFMIVLIKLDLI